MGREIGYSILRHLKSIWRTKTLTISRVWKPANFFVLFRSSASVFCLFLDRHFLTNNRSKVLRKTMYFLCCMLCSVVNAFYLFLRSLPSLNIDPPPHPTSHHITHLSPHTHQPLGSGPPKHHQVEGSVLRVSYRISGDGALSRWRAVRRNHTQCTKGTRRGDLIRLGWHIPSGNPLYDIPPQSSPHLLHYTSIFLVSVCTRTHYLFRAPPLIPFTLYWSPSLHTFSLPVTSCILLAPPHSHYDFLPNSSPPPIFIFQHYPP